MRTYRLSVAALTAITLGVAGCAGERPPASTSLPVASPVKTVARPAPVSVPPATTPKPAAPEPAPAAKSAYDKPGFLTRVDDGRLWVLQPGEKRSDKHVTMIGAGPGGMTLKALSRDTALAYLAAKPGFDVRVEDERLWVLRPGEKTSDKHITMIGAGPGGMTVKALEKNTALAYLAAKPGFQVEIEDGRLWVLRPGEKKSDKHVTLIGAGPRGMTLKALDRQTAQAYLAARPGFKVEIEDGRLWVLKPGQQKSDKHVTRIGAGPGGMTVKALDRETLTAYLRAGATGAPKEVSR